MGRLLATLAVASLVFGIFVVFGETKSPATARLALMQAAPTSAAQALVVDAEGGRVRRSPAVAACVEPCLPDMIEMKPILANQRPAGLGVSG